MSSSAVGIQGPFIDPFSWDYTASARADLQGMTCQGNFPIFAPYLLDPRFSPFTDTPANPGTYRNLLQICARAEWGGASINAYGTCSQLSKSPYSILFDTRSIVWRGSETTDNRLALYCKTKCRCTGGTSGDIPPLPRISSNIGSTITYMLMDKSRSIFRNIYNLEGLRLDWARVEYLSWAFGRLASNTILIGGLTERRIKCNGPLPNHSAFTVPLGTKYENLLDFCAAEIYGGDAHGNMGGYCYTSSEPETPSVRFDSEFAHPHLMGRPPLLGYCSHYCRCLGAQDESARRADSASSVNINEPVDTVVLRPPPPPSRRYGNEQKPVTMSVEPSRSGRKGGDPRRKLVDVRFDICNSWNEKGCEWLSIYHDDNWCPYGQDGSNCTFESLQTAPPVSINPDPLPDFITRNNRPIGRPKTRPPAQDQCEGPCTGPRQCSGSDCRCMVAAGLTDITDQRDPVFASSSCRSFALAMLAGSGLGKRNIDTSSNVPGCPCNTSYVSSGCCDSEDGLIWESPGMKMGVLK